MEVGCCVAGGRSCSSARSAASRPRSRACFNMAGQYNAGVGGHVIDVRLSLGFPKKTLADSPPGLLCFGGVASGNWVTFRLYRAFVFTRLYVPALYPPPRPPIWAKVFKIST